MIKNIIFDLGGVLLDVNVELTYTQLGEAMGLEVQSKQIPSHIYKLILGYEKGEINTETFLWNLQKESTNLPPQPNQLIRAWNAMILKWKPERLDFLMKLKKEFKVFLLSNSNDLHLERIRRNLKMNHQIVDFDTKYFDKTFYSHLMKLRKPEIKIFEKVLIETGINPKETLFIDDTEENVEKAREAGLHAVCHNTDDNIIDSIKRYLKEHNA